MKFRIESEEHSEQIQKELFRLGFRWMLVNSKKALHVKCGSLTAYWDSMHIFCMHGTEDDFLSHKNTETTLEELKEM